MMSVFPNIKLTQLFTIWMLFLCEALFQAWVMTPWAWSLYRKEVNMYFSPAPVLTATALGMIMAVFSLVTLLTEDRGTANFDQMVES